MARKLIQAGFLRCSNITVVGQNSERSSRYAIERGAGEG
jgi:hypothetical protein